MYFWSMNNKYIVKIVKKSFLLQSNREVFCSNTCILKTYYYSGRCKLKKPRGLTLFFFINDKNQKKSCRICANKKKAIIDDCILTTIIFISRKQISSLKGVIKVLWNNIQICKLWNKFSLWKTIYFR